MSIEYPGFGRQWLTHPTLPEPAERLAVAWSGGADSTALLLALKAAGHDVTAWHIDHGWRAESAEQAAALADLAGTWGVDFCQARLAPASAANLEAGARADRYQQFELWGREQGIASVCLGHQRDDQAETVCMRLLQGAGTRGCRGMARERRQGALRIIRPLLHVSSGELRAALSEIGVQWVEDASNRDVRFRRNLVRQRLFPAMRAADYEPAELFLAWQRAAERLSIRLDQEAQALFEQPLKGSDGVCVRWRDWAAASQPVRARALQLMMARLFGEGVTPGRRHIELAESWTKRSGLGGLDLSRCRLQRRSRFLHLEPTTAGLHG
ncbi:MAG: tRNA lysidine(34) synthetase TilS [Mariprofundaceae bacterium]